MATMNISPGALLTQYRRARREWPFLGETAHTWGLPPGMLHAVGSRETNLRNVIGDGGHGHGMFQLDDRFHQIPAGFDSDVQAQASTAARMLAALYLTHQNWTRALNAYNSGSPHTDQTTGKDYGPDVLARQQWLARRLKENAQVVIENHPQTVPSGELKFIFPVGSTSEITERGWLSLAITAGTGSADVFLQADDHGIEHWTLPLGKDHRVYRELPDGLTQFTIQWQISPGAQLGIGLEAMPKIR